MWDFENRSKTMKNLEPYSRFVASWINACRRNKIPVYFTQDFKDWLRLIQVPEDDISNICEMACCGKMEIEASANVFIKNYVKPDFNEEEST